ncbi:MAG: glycosyltransferase family 1 protein [Mariprofundaceae bacterium]
MRIGVSAFAGDGGKSGISQYMINMFRQLPDCSPNDEFVLFMAEADREFLDLNTPRTRVHTLPNWVGHPVINIFWHLLVLPFVLRSQGCDCVFMPAGNRRLAWWYGMPSVGTIHDLSQLHVPAKYDGFRMFYIMRVLPRLMRKLTRVVSISEATRRDLEGFAQVESNRIQTVYNGADVSVFTPGDKQDAKRRINEALNIPPDYMLYISRLEHPGKNHVRLIEALSRMKARSDLPHKLVLVGSRWNGAEAIDAAVRDFGMQDEVIFPGFVPNDLLPDLYVGADLFVFPSLFEGFGIPVLEAMAAGTPVCSSNAASLPEVVGDAGLLFDPEDVASMADCMQRVLGDQALAARLVRKGLKQARKFSWHDAAQDVLKLCHEAAVR